jgi:hypothetical protein
MLEGRLVPSTIRTITYDQITSLPSSTPLNGDFQYNVLSAKGNRAVFAVGPGGGIDDIYTVNSDGSGLTQVDSKIGISALNISADGSVVLEQVAFSGTETQLRVNGQTLLDIGVHPYSMASCLSAIGTTVFFEEAESFTIGTQHFDPGLYSLSTVGASTPQLLVSADQVSQLVNPPTSAYVYMGVSDGSLEMGVSSDGSHLVFPASFGGVGQINDSLLAVNTNGSDLHEIGPFGQANNMNAAGISGDGSKVFRYDGFNNNQLTVYNFDGSDPVVLNNLPHDNAIANGRDRIELTQDGSKLLLGTSSLLVNTDNSGMVQIGTHVGLNTSNPPFHALVGTTLYHATMDSSGTVFLFTTGDLNGAQQLAVARLNTASPGGDPAISNISISPSYLLTNSGATTTISAAVSGSNLVGVSEAFMLNGVSENDAIHDFTDTQLYDDGTNGDANTGDGTYTNNAITIHYDPPTGPRTVRVSGETVDGSGLQHVTSVEVDGLTVVTQAPVVSTNLISGTIFQDVNGNGVQDAGEPGIAEQTLYLDLDGSGQLKAGDPTAVTDANGNYQFTGLSAGTYTVRQVLSGGALLSAPANGSYQVTVMDGASVTGENFADVSTSIAVRLTLPPRSAFPAQGTATADYVEGLYRSILNRNADASGLAFWTSQLNSGALSRLQVVQGIRQSVEHFTQEVTDFYYTLLGRAPDAAGLQSWVQNLENGLPEEQMAFAFLDSPEYLSKGDKYFVDQMYQSLLGRPFDAAGEANWLNALGDDASGNATSTSTLTHEQVITDFLYSQESLTRLTEGYYQVYLQRQADTAGLERFANARHTHSDAGTNP